jgi:hypothetical protein
LGKRGAVGEAAVSCCVDVWPCMSCGHPWVCLHMALSTGATMVHATACWLHNCGPANELIHANSCNKTNIILCVPLFLTYTWLFSRSVFFIKSFHYIERKSHLSYLFSPLTQMMRTEVGMEGLVPLLPTNTNDAPRDGGRNGGARSPSSCSGPPPLLPPSPFIFQWIFWQ